MVCRGENRGATRGGKILEAGDTSPAQQGTKHRRRGRVRLNPRVAPLARSPSAVLPHPSRYPWASLSRAVLPPSIRPAAAGCRPLGSGAHGVVRLWKTLPFSLVFRFPSTSRPPRPRPGIPSVSLPPSIHRGAAGSRTSGSSAMVVQKVRRRFQGGVKPRRERSGDGVRGDGSDEGGRKRGGFFQRPSSRLGRPRC